MPRAALALVPLPMAHALAPNICIIEPIPPWLLGAWAALVALLLAEAAAVAATFRGARALPGGPAALRHSRLGRHAALVTAVAFALAAAEAATAVAFILDTDQFYATALATCGQKEPVGQVDPWGTQAALVAVGRALPIIAVWLVPPAIALLVAAIRWRRRLVRGSR